jgi:ABC-2 type transport system permease protein
MASGGIWESVVKYIAAKEHLDSFFKGVLTVADVTYFICFVAVFLFFTNIVLDSQRWR